VAVTRGTIRWCNPTAAAAAPGNRHWRYRPATRVCRRRRASRRGRRRARRERWRCRQRQPPHQRRPQWQQWPVVNSVGCQCKWWSPLHGSPCRGPRRYRRHWQQRADDDGGWAVRRRRRQRARRQCQWWAVRHGHWRRLRHRCSSHGRGGWLRSRHWQRPPFARLQCPIGARALFTLRTAAGAGATGDGRRGRGRWQRTAASAWCRWQRASIQRRRRGGADVSFAAGTGSNRRNDGPTAAAAVSWWWRCQCQCRWRRPGRGGHESPRRGSVRLPLPHRHGRGGPGR